MSFLLPLLFSNFNMAGKIPTPVALVLLTAIESFGAITFLPEYAPAKLSVTIFYALSFNILLWIVYNVWIWPFFITPLRHLPGPKGGYPILGHALVPLKRPPGVDFLRWMAEIPNDGILKFHAFFNEPTLLVTNPTAMADMLQARPYDFQKSENSRDLLRIIIGEGLLVSEGDMHKFQRKNLLPMFGFRQIKDLYPMMNIKAETLIESISNKLREDLEKAKDEEQYAGDDTTVIEMNGWADRSTLDMIGVAGLGHQFNSLRNSDDVIAKKYFSILEPNPARLPWFITILLLGKSAVDKLPLGLNKTMDDAVSSLRGSCWQFLQDRKAQIAKAPEEHFDVLAGLIKTNNFSDDELMDQLLTFLAAGHETTANTFTWVVHVLARDPVLQTRLRKEIQGAMPGGVPNGDLATVLESLPYLNGVINETLRMFPVVPLTRRTAIRDSRIGDLHVPKGTPIEISIWSIHRSPQIWGEGADKFVPERWIDGEAAEDGTKLNGHPNNHGGTPSVYSMLSFLAGPRSCIGARFARAELRVLTAQFLLNFEFEPADWEEEIIPFGIVTIKPQNGLHIKVKKI
ncbi:cytochrome P450 [Aulographum hederae CBS 113979]|uniref:Cytochrome P450 n=1 Tax=Aulographum hederae CBS 113979 TaxID=1176131 RepID=A0A6G1H7S0_9PEZI|nr:cytochrome P450 [Aulographum hederae CBS 113979]